MKRIREPDQIWCVTLLDQDIQAGIDYGIISRAWTYDRMGAQAKGDFGKAIFRIAVGRAIQAAFERILRGKNIIFVRDTTDYKEEDYWDMTLKNDKSVDIKSFHVFTDYVVPEREETSKELIFSSTLGDRWNTFFPMLIPQDQFDGAVKDYYIFAILTAPSSKRFPNTRPKPQFLISLPYSKDKEVNDRYRNIHRAKPARLRVEEKKTFSILLDRDGQNTLFGEPIRLTIGYGDIHGDSKKATISLRARDSKRLDGLTSFHYLKAHHSCMTSSTREKIVTITFPDVDDEGDLVWEVYNHSFEDIWIYDSRVFFVGWVSKEAFAKARDRLPAYGPNEEYSGNTDHWEKDAVGLLSRKSFCYFYPPVFRGGTQNPNYYCLPKDLYPMDEIFKLFKGKIS